MSLQSQTQRPLWAILGLILSLVQAALCGVLAFHYTLPQFGPAMALGLWVAGLFANRLFTPHAQSRSLAKARSNPGIVRRIGKSLAAAPRRLFDNLARSLLALAGLSALIVLAWSLRALVAQPWASIDAEHSYPLGQFPAVALAALAFGGYFLRVFRGVSARSADPQQARGETLLASAGDALMFGNGLFAAFLFFEAYSGLTLHSALAAVLSIFLCIWIAETLLRWAVRFYQPNRIWQKAAPLGTSVVLRFLRLGAAERLHHSSEEDEGVMSFKLSEMWLLPTIGRALLPMSILALAVVWLSSTAHEVPYGSSGLRRSMGRLGPEPLEAGIHFSLPWPFGKIERFATGQVSELVVGMASDPAQPILWDRAHYVGEQNMLVGNGEELLTLAAPILYRISDPYAFALRTIDAEAALRPIAAKAILDATARQSAFDIMTTNRDALRLRIHEDIQASLDERKAGIEVVSVWLRDIHPPVDVAPAYQEVVSAEEDREAFVYAGEEYKSRIEPQAVAQSARLKKDADAQSETRLLQVRGEAESFEVVAAAYADSPRAFRSRTYYAAFDDSLTGVKKLIMDGAFAGPATAYVDLRKTLNPAMVERGLPAPQSLIPAGRVGDEVFMKAIDGIRQMGNGEAPAPDFTPDDPDNLFEN